MTTITCPQGFGETDRARCIDRAAAAQAGTGCLLCPIPPVLIAQGGEGELNQRLANRLQGLLSNAWTPEKVTESTPALEMSGHKAPEKDKTDQDMAQATRPAFVGPPAPSPEELLRRLCPTSARVKRKVSKAPQPTPAKVKQAAPAKPKPTREPKPTPGRILAQAIRKALALGSAVELPKAGLPRLLSIYNALPDTKPLPDAAALYRVLRRYSLPVNRTPRGSYSVEANDHIRAFVRGHLKEAA